MRTWVRTRPRKTGEGMGSYNQENTTQNHEKAI